MADPTPAADAAPETPAPAGPPPRVLPLVLLYTLARVALAVGLIALVWFVGLPGFPALLFGVLLQMPLSYVLLRPLRDKLALALLARRENRRAAREDLRARLAGDEPDPE